MLRFLKNLIQLLLNPGQGWEDIREENVSPAIVTSKGFYPMLAIVTLSCLGSIFKIGGNATFASIICAMLVTFTSYFVAIFISRYCFAVAMPKLTDNTITNGRMSIFIDYSLGLMMLIDVVVNVLPFGSVLFKFLPIYVGVIMYKAEKYLGVQSQYAGHFMFLSVFTVMVPPYLIYYLFRLLFPEI